MIQRHVRLLPLVPLVGLVLTACGSTSTAVGEQLQGPTSIVAFRGCTWKYPATETTHPYLAVTSSLSDQLRIIDVKDDQPVLGRGVIFPLSIPTAPRPLLVAAASLGDDKPDVLVAVSAGGLPYAAEAAQAPALQVVQTWPTRDAITGEEEIYSRIAYDVSLRSALGAGAEILSIVGLNVAPGSGRILVGASGGQLAIVDFTRDATSGAPVAGTPVVKVLGFDPLDLALDPYRGDEGYHVNVATTDPVASGVYGAARFLASGEVSAVVAAPVQALNALAGTVAVASAKVYERVVDPADSCSHNNLFAAPPAQGYVYAVLDSGSCGPDKAINCGVVALNPVTGALAPDLNGPDDGAGWQSYRAPIPVPGVPSQIAIGQATRLTDVTVGNSAEGDCWTRTVPAGTETDETARLLLTAPATGKRYTHAMAAVTSSSSGVFWLDLSRWAPMSNQSLVSGSTAVKVSWVSSILPEGVDSGRGGIGLIDPSGNLVSDSLRMVDQIHVWPGFTDSDHWTVTWQGPLPGLERRAAWFSVASGVASVGIQSLVSSSAPARTWTVGAVIADAALGVHAGDVVEFPDLGCEGTVAALPSAATEPFPGGHMEISDAVRIDASGARTAEQCVFPAAEGPTTVTVRAREFILVSAKHGYFGRPSKGIEFSAAWKDETGLTGEELSLARKARRLFYPSDAPCRYSEVPEKKCRFGGDLVVEPTAPIAPGPVLRFTVGFAGTTVVRGAGIAFETLSGLAPTMRAPSGSFAFPTDVIFFEGVAGADQRPFRFYAPFVDNQVIGFHSDESMAGVDALR